MRSDPAYAVFTDPCAAFADFRVHLPRPAPYHRSRKNPCESITQAS
jgi:hypothetical protein